MRRGMISTVWCEICVPSIHEWPETLKTTEIFSPYVIFLVRVNCVVGGFEDVRIQILNLPHSRSQITKQIYPPLTLARP
jgi:hypothetical protein